MPNGEDYKKQHKTNSKRECDAFKNCGSLSKSKIPDSRNIFNSKSKKTKGDTNGGGTVKIKVYEAPEKFSYQAGTAKAGEPMQEKPEITGTGMSKEERDAALKKYQTRY
jgi:hypothetical protein